MTMTAKERREMIRRAEGLYYPCSFGIHVCGDKDGAAATLGNVRARDAQQARVIFEAAKAEAAVSKDEDWDMVVDLNLGEGNLHSEDFCIRRQMLDRCLAAARAALSA
ncbi:MAG: hypothetical protein JWL86_5448 [Rhizobium sp.]|nr:hypothetical protein [Rhizobium sp.]